MKAMDQNFSSTPTTGIVYLAISFIGVLVGWITSFSVHEILQGLAHIVSIGAGIMAIRHYYLQNKKPKPN